MYTHSTGGFIDVLTDGLAGTVIEAFTEAVQWPLK
jgi:hypothetical protein